MKRENSGQMIILMGILLSLSIFVLSSLSADIINLDVSIANERATSLSSEFRYIKEAFGSSLNYNLIYNVTNETIDNQPRLIMRGNPSNITAAFEQTTDQFYYLELRYGNIFDAEINRYWYSHRTDEKDVYYINVKLILEDGETNIEENVQYSLLIQP